VAAAFRNEERREREVAADDDGGGGRERTTEGAQRADREGNRGQRDGGCEAGEVTKVEEEA